MSKRELFVMFLSLQEKLNLINIMVTACRGKMILLPHTNNLFYCYVPCNKVTSPEREFIAFGHAVCSCWLPQADIMEIRISFILQAFPPLIPLFQAASRRGTIFYFVEYISVDDPHETWHTEVPLRPCFLPLTSVLGSHCLFITQLGSTCCESAKPNSSSFHTCFCA